MILHNSHIIIIYIITIYFSTDIHVETMHIYKLHAYPFFAPYISSINQIQVSYGHFRAKCKTTVSPVRQQWRYSYNHNLALRHLSVSYGVELSDISCIWTHIVLNLLGRAESLYKRIFPIVYKWTPITFLLLNSLHLS